MNSVVDIGSKANKSLNFILVGYGQCDMVQAFLKYACKQISANIMSLPVLLYSQRTLDLAETKPELLRKGARLPLRITHGAVDKEYIGFCDGVDLNELYQYLYAAPPGFSSPFQGPLFYSRSNLSRVVQEKLGTTESAACGMLGDVEVRFAQNFCGQGKLCVRIEYKINEMLIKDISCDTDWFRCLVEEMDSQFPEALRTAYISFSYPQMPIIHEHVYDSYNIDLLESKVLGTEWYGYFNKNIVEHLELPAYEKLAELTQITQMQNGISYIATNSVTKFDALLREEISCVLKDVLIPAFSVYDWSRLCRQQWNVNYLPQKISVYHDTYTPEDPAIVFSFNLDTDQLAELKGLLPKNLIDIFST